MDEPETVIIVGAGDVEATREALRHMGVVVVAAEPMPPADELTPIIHHYIRNSNCRGEYPMFRPKWNPHKHRFKKQKGKNARVGIR